MGECYWCQLYKSFSVFNYFKKLNQFFRLAHHNIWHYCVCNETCKKEVVP
jgi:hypothetical protein